MNNFFKYYIILTKSVYIHKKSKWIIKIKKIKDSNYIINEYLNIYYNLNDKIRKSGKIEVLNGKQN